ncbi:SigE family RNA polymerase sigma factor [Yinghuangia soli]|uniref:SigE family RNA polymerase sigma factor n=1 Tax=Yinghuangia soli TaxID=2908204 RepID=A0AA41PUE8_9ACTN|nr:SigE family RNA polymerase sigma factor [Yinghuangia soli]MCF2526069.1 SigE family RNA polymerase sigma factor [Yinghuangia soli]
MARGTRDRDGFSGFAAAAAPRLRRTGYLLCGDWHLAEDLAQTALEKLYVAWPRVAQAGNQDAYARRVLVNAYLDRGRRRSSGETPGLDSAALEGTEARPEGDPDLRVTLLDALTGLPARDRAVLVLRYWEDLSVETTAEHLGLTPSAVKTISGRCLARLRGALADLAPTAHPANEAPAAS